MRFPCAVASSPRRKSAPIAHREARIAPRYRALRRAASGLPPRPRLSLRRAPPESRSRRPPRPRVTVANRGRRRSPRRRSPLRRVPTRELAPYPFRQASCQRLLHGCALQARYRCPARTDPALAARRRTRRSAWRTTTAISGIDRVRACDPLPRDCFRSERPCPQTLHLWPGDWI